MTWQELVVSVQAAILLTPLHLLVVHIFRLVQPPAVEPAAPRGDTPSLPLGRVPSAQRPSITGIQQVRAASRSSVLQAASGRGPGVTRHNTDGFPSWRESCPGGGV